MLSYIKNMKRWIEEYNWNTDDIDAVASFLGVDDEQKYPWDGEPVKNAIEIMMKEFSPGEVNDVASSFVPYPFEWPKFEDGSFVNIGDEVSGESYLHYPSTVSGKVQNLTFYTNGVKLEISYDSKSDAVFYEYGEFIKQGKQDTIDLIRADVEDLVDSKEYVGVDEKEINQIIDRVIKVMKRDYDDKDCKLG